jgi:hypothetical protein
VQLQPGSAGRAEMFLVLVRTFEECEYAMTVVTARCVAEMNCAMASPLSFGKAMKPAKIADVARTKTTFCGKVRIGRLCHGFIDQL